jgi:hypothetical protein
MSLIQRSDGYSMDQYAVRPGTSDALFARSIDATQPPPLVKAQEAVAAAIPKLIDSVPPPLVGTTLGLTVLAVMVASHRLQFKMVPILTAGVLLLPISNYHPAQRSEQLQAQEVVVTDEQRARELSEWENTYSRREKPEPDEEDSDADSEEDSDDAESDSPRAKLLIPPEITDGVVPLAKLVVPDEWTDEQQLRVLRRRAERLMEEIRELRLQQQLQEEFEQRRQSLTSRRYHRL